MSVRAWTVGDRPGPDNLRLVELPDRDPGPLDVVVRTRAVSLNYRDLLVVAGRYQRRLQSGAIPCSDAAGEVIAVGADVARVRPGDRVTSTFAPAWLDGPLSRVAIQSIIGAGLNPGVLADTFTLHENAVVPAPPGLSFEEAATLPCAALTAWHALFEEGTARTGDLVLTLGTGGVSLFAIQFALHAGLRILATSGDDGKIERLAAMGVTDVINYRKVPLWGERARERSGGDGVDQIIEVGGQGTLEQSLRAVRPGGTISLIGNVAETAPVSLVPALMRNIRVQGIVVGSRVMFDRMNRAIDGWGMVPIIDRVFAFDHARAAFEYLASGRHLGKVVIAIGERR